MNIPNLPDVVPHRFEGHADRLTYLLAEYRMGVYLFAIAGFALVASGRAGVPELPPIVGIALQGFLAGILPAFILGKKVIVDKFIPDQRLRVLVVDPHQGMATTAKKVSRGTWENRRRGDLPAFEPREGNVDYVVTHFEWFDDLEVLEVEGVNEEIANPLDVLARDGVLDEVYGELLDAYKELARLKATIRSKTTRIEADNVNALMAAYEHGTSFRPGDAGRVIDRDEWEEHEADAEDRDRTDDAARNGHEETLSQLAAIADGGREHEQ
jgi:hypothetical protein